MTNAQSNTVLNALLPEWHLLLQGWALDGSLATAAKEALLLDETPRALQNLITQWSMGDFGALPPIVLLPAADMNGAMGAYAIGTGTIYLNADWLARASNEQVHAVLTEELGHHLDGILNAVDTPGDEGQYLYALMAAKEATQRTQTQPDKENDFITINIKGESIAAEGAFSSLIIESTFFRPELAAQRPDGKDIWDEVLLDNQGFWVIEDGILPAGSNIGTGQYEVNISRFIYASTEVRNYTLLLTPSELQRSLIPDTAGPYKLNPYSDFAQGQSNFIIFEERTRDRTDSQGSPIAGSIYPWRVIDVESLTTGSPVVIQIGDLLAPGNGTYFEPRYSISGIIRNEAGLEVVKNYTFVTLTNRDVGNGEFINTVERWDANSLGNTIANLTWAIEMPPGISANVAVDSASGAAYVVTQSQIEKNGNAFIDGIGIRRYSLDLDPGMEAPTLMWSKEISPAELDLQGLTGYGGDVKIDFATVSGELLVTYGNTLLAYTLDGLHMWSRDVPGLSDISQDPISRDLVVTRQLPTGEYFVETLSISGGQTTSSQMLPGFSYVTGLFVDNNGIVNILGGQDGLKAVIRLVTDSAASSSFNMSSTAATLDISSASLVAVNGNSLSNTITGNSLDNLINPGDGNDVVNAENGDDKIVAGSGKGNDTYNGGAGIDTAIYTSTTAGVEINLRTGVAWGVETDHDILISIENFVLGHGQNSFTGDSANNHVDGAAGNSDTVNLQGDFSDYSIQVVEGGYVLADNRDSSSLDYDGVDTYLSVESFAFKNGLYSAEQLLPPPLSNIPERNIDEPSLLISGLSGLSGLSGAGNLITIEKLGLIPTTRIIGRGKHARTVTVSLPGWETMETMDSISGLTLTAGNGLNTISAAGQPSNAAKPAFNGQFIADGRLGVDIITGGSYRNWLIGGGIVARGSETGLSSLGIDTLIGTTGALDVFDLRSSDGLSDAYANHNAGRALISNFSVGEDAIILSGSQADYNVNINTVTKGRGKRVTTSTIVEIKSSMSTQVIASFSGSAFTSSTSAADLNIHYGILTDPSSTLINGQSLFF